MSGNGKLRKPVVGSRSRGTVAYLGGIPAVPEEFCWCWGQMVQYNAEHLTTGKLHVHYDRAKVSYHETARNSLAERFLGDWLMQLDCDQTFDPDIVHRLLHRLQSRDEVQVLTGVYFTRKPPHVPVLYGWDKEKKLFPRIGAFGDRAAMLPDSKPKRFLDGLGGCELFEVGGAGGGCLMVRRQVFDLIDEKLNEQPFSIRPPYSEDLSFFARCQELGVKVWCDPRIICGHLTDREITDDDWEPVGLSEFVEA